MSESSSLSSGKGGAAGNAGHADILERIVARTRRDLALRREQVPVHELRRRPLYQAERRDFAGALRAACTAQVPALIAEVKKASPSKGVIRADFDPLAIAQAYTRAGAACLSVLTDEPFFQGSLAYLEAIAGSVVGVPPLLRKDFILDEYQLEEARAFGADAVLLIVACLDDATLRRLHRTTLDLGMQALVEAYDVTEAQRALAAGVAMLGINNRNLRDFQVDLGQTERAFGAIRTAGVEGRVLLVSESGIASHADARHLRQLGAEAMLVGEHLMRHGDVEGAVLALLGQC